MNGALPDIDFLTEQLQRVKPFMSIAMGDLRELIRIGQVVMFPAEAVIFGEDEECAGLFVLLSGQVQICRHSPAGQVSILTIFEPVIMLNEAAALDGGPNPVTAITCRPATLWRISAEQLQAFLLAHPQISLALLRVMAGRNRRLVAHFQDLSFRTVQARAAKLLLELSQGGTSAIDRRRHPNHQLAGLIATVPEAFSRALRELRQAGALELSPQAIRISQAEVLRKLAQLELF